MREYVIKRVLWFIPTLFIITLLGFTLLVNSPGDPLDHLVNSLNSRASTSSNDIENQKTYWRKQLGLDLPLFYFSVTQLSQPDTLYKIYDKQKLHAFKILLDYCGNAEAVSRFFNTADESKKVIVSEITKLNADSSSTKNNLLKLNAQTVLATINSLYIQPSPLKLTVSIELLKNQSVFFPGKFKETVNSLSTRFKELDSDQTRYKNFFPKFTWHGSISRYHHWLFGGSNSKGVLYGDFGISYIKKEPVSGIIKDKMIWSVFFSVLSIILAYVISVPIGISMAINPNSKKNKLIEIVLFLMYSMPSFFVGVLLLMLFANPDLLSLFPPSGIKPIGGYSMGRSLPGKIAESLPYIILPLICYTYSSVAFISKLTQTTISEQLGFDYIQTARAKGLSERKVILKHAFKNSLLPLITVFSSIFPAVIGGSVIIESIFTIPGMGLETVKAIVAKDFPIVIAVITLSAILTMLSYLVADILYAWADPRIRYKT